VVDTELSELVAVTEGLVDDVSVASLDAGWVISVVDCAALLVVPSVVDVARLTGKVDVVLGGASWIGIASMGSA